MLKSAEFSIDSERYAELHLALGDIIQLRYYSPQDDEMIEALCEIVNVGFAPDGKQLISYRVEPMSE